MADSIARLVAELDALIEFFDRVGENHWSRWAWRARGEIVAGDREGLRHIRGAYGGMGSLNDLVVHPGNGHQVTKGEIHAANEELRRRAGTVLDVAMAIELGLRRKRSTS